MTTVEESGADPLQNQLARLPAEMRSARRWLLHDDRKKPYYVDGTSRQGKLDSAADVARFALLEDAVEALDKDGGRRFAGLGFALGEDGGQWWQGIDLDKAIDGDGNLTKEAREILSGSSAYVERSPSGRGFHVIGRGAQFRALNSRMPGVQAIEAYSERRYLTVTADVWRDGPLEDLAPQVEKIRASRPRKTDPQTEDFLRFISNASQKPVDPKLRRWLADHPIDQALQRDGFVEFNGRWLSPRSKSGIPGVRIIDGERAISFHASDEGLGTTGDSGCHVFNAFDLEVYERFAGDRRRAWRELIDPIVPTPALPLLGGTEPQRYMLRTIDEMERLPPPSWIVESLIPERGLTVVFGPPGSGKSFLALYLMLTMAAGQDWFGRPVRPTISVYLALEGRYGIAQRVRAHISRYGREGEEVFFVDGDFSLSCNEDLSSLVSAIQAAGTVGLIVIDTLSRASAGSDENDSRDMGLLIRGLQFLQDALGCSVVVVHHTGKAEGRGPRGHSSLLAAVDVAIEVQRASGHGEDRIWRCVKNKDGPDGASGAFRLAPVSFFSGDAKTLESAVVEERMGATALPPRKPRGANRQTILPVIIELIGATPPAAAGEDRKLDYDRAWRAASQALPAKVPLNRRDDRAKETLQGLVDDGFLRSDKKHVWLP